MPHPLAEKLEQLATTWNRRVTTTFVAAAIAVVLLTIFVGGLLDYLVRFRDLGLRTLLSFGVTASMVAVCVFAWRRVRLRRHTSFGIARQVERSFPEMGDRLASAIAFLGQGEGDPRAGSDELRRRVIGEATADSETLPLATALELPEERWAWQLLVPTLVVGLVLLVTAPSLVATAALRLAAPWGNAAWPRSDHLELIELPTLVARGDDFEVELVNITGDVPPDTELEFRYETDGRRTIDRMPAARVGDRLLARRQNVQRSFNIRAVGGDDHTMRWHEVEVVDPPRLTKSRFRIVAPAYSGIAETTAERQLRVLAGSQIEWSGTTSEPVTTARILFDTDSPPAIDIGVSTAGRLGVSLEDWIAKATEKPTTYRVAMTNAAGLTGETSSYNYEVVADVSPTVAWQTDEREQLATTRAIVPLALTASDDLAVQTVAVDVVPLGGDQNATAVTSVTLYDNGSNPPAKANFSVAVAEPLVVEGQIDLESLELPPGTQFKITATATDYGGQKSHTDRPLAVTIVTDDEFASLIANEQESLLNELLRALETQRSAREQTSRLASKLSPESPVERPQLDVLIAATNQQQQVASLLGDKPLGVAARAAELRLRIANNRFDSGPIDGQLLLIVDTVAVLLRKQLPDIQQKLTDTRSDFEQIIASAHVDNLPAITALALIDARQQEVIEALERLLDGLQQWGDTEQFLRELANLASSQRELAARAKDLAKRSMSERTDDPALPAAAEQLAADQNELARRFRRVEQGLKSLAERQEMSGDMRDRIDDAVGEAADREIARVMSDAARQLGDGQTSRASEQQEAVADDLQNMVDRLRALTPTDPAQLAEALKQAARDLSELKNDTAQNAKLPDGQPKQAERDNLANRMQRLARELRRLTAPQAGDSAQAAGNKMEGEPPQDQPAPEQQAQEKLDEAREQLENRLAQLEQEREQRALERLAAELGKLIPIQKTILERTLMHEREMPNDGEFADQLTAALQVTAELQTQVASELRVAINNVEARQVFQLALAGAADDMQRAADLLAENDPGRTTQNAELAALTRMQQVADVLAPTPPANDDEESEPQDSPPGDGDQGEQKPPPTIELAEVKMVRWLQVELNGRTRGVEADLAAMPEPTSAEAQLADQLAREQSRLADLIGEMLQRRGSPESGGPDL